MTTLRLPRPGLLSLAVALCAAVVAVGLFAPADAHAHRTVTMYEYDGNHPIPEPFEGWCEEHGLHVHSYYLHPDEYPIYEIDGVIHFMGDPMLYGWRGDVNWYYDPHPVGHIDHHWCVLEGPHTHLWAPIWTHRHYGRRYWSTYDRYYVYTGYYDGWFTWSWDLYYTRLWGVHVRVVNRYRPYYRNYHPIYTYVDHRDRRPAWSGRHRHRSNHDSARPRDSWGGDRGRDRDRTDARPGTGDTARPRSGSGGAANAGATWEGGRAAGSRDPADKRAEPSDRRSYGASGWSSTRTTDVAPDRSYGTTGSGAATGQRSRSADPVRSPDTSRYGSSRSSSGSRTYGSSPSYDSGSRYGSSRSSSGSSSSKYGSSRSSSGSRSYGGSPTYSGSSSRYGSSRSSGSSSKYGSSRSSGSSSSRYSTPSRSSSSTRYGYGSSSSSSSSSSSGSSSSKSSSSRSKRSSSSSNSKSSRSSSSSSRSRSRR